MCTVHNLDVQRTDAFAENLIDMLNKGSLSLMVSIGHRTGLFDAMSQLPPANSEQIAKAAGLNERYVREWLGAMTVGGIVECIPTDTKPLFSLPGEHASSLTRAAGADNISVFAQYVGLLGSVEDRVVECFKNGGGVGYEEFTRFHEVMAEDSGQSMGSSLFDAVLPLVPGLIRELEDGIDVLDIGCGQGRAVNMLAQRFPNSRFTGYDLCEEPIATARTEAKSRGLNNVRFEQKDLTDFDVNGEYHLATAFDAIHDQSRPDNVLAGVCRVLRDDGVFLMQDISGSSEVQNNMKHPIAPFLYTVSTMHCMTVSLAQGGMGLGTMWGREKAQEMLRAAGFNQIEIHNLSHDIQNDYYVVRK